MLIRIIFRPNCDKTTFKSSERVLGWKGHCWMCNEEKKQIVLIEVPE